MFDLGFASLSPGFPALPVSVFTPSSACRLLGLPAGPPRYLGGGGEEAQNPGISNRRFQTGSTTQHRHFSIRLFCVHFCSFSYICIHLLFDWIASCAGLIKFSDLILM